jgi:predicted small integral membrane protein
MCLTLVVTAFLISLGVLGLVSSSTASADVRSATCAATSSSADAVNPLDDAVACSGGETAVKEAYEAALAGAGLLLFGAAMLVYRRRRPGSQPRLRSHLS